MDTEVQHTLYEQDFSAWAFEQARLVRERRWDALDTANIAEELETLGRYEQKELRSRLGILIGHLLKWQYQLERRSRSWSFTIQNQRREIKELIEDSPSLQSHFAGAILRGYDQGVHLAAEETGLPLDTFPATCPYSQQELMDEQFLPDSQQLADTKYVGYEPPGS